jgi:ligand-binding sensor domain-containing protein
VTWCSWVRIRELTLGVLLACGWVTEAWCGPAPHFRPEAELPVTDGLIRWWPNLFDVRDEMTGQEGVVMGVLPPVETEGNDDTEFGPRTGWVQLQPALTNEVFTLSFWVRARPASEVNRLLGQESAAGVWLFQFYPGDAREFFIGPHHFQDADHAEHVSLIPEVWHHVAIGRRADGTCLIWVDGVRALNGQRSHAWPAGSRWLTVGNSWMGSDDPFRGWLRDLCAFDRVLTDREAEALHEAGVPRRPARNTAARLAATERSVNREAPTPIVVPPSRTWDHRRFTTEDGLPGNVVKAVWQARDGYLWVGTEDGLARFDGRRFRAFTADNTPALKAIGQKVWSLSEDADRTLWAGVFGGLLRIRGLEFTAFTHGLPQRFVLQAEPAGDGSVWVAGFNAFVPRGPLWLRRYHPDSGVSSAEVVVPGHLRRMVVATNGVWLATEQPPLLLFWDGQAPAATVIAAVEPELPMIRFARRSSAADVEVRTWSHGGDGIGGWAEVRPGEGLPPFRWLWDPRSRRPWAARWKGPANAGENWLGVFRALARQRGPVLEAVDFADPSASREIVCATPNREGGIWFGTEEDGLHFVQERPIRVYTAQDGLSGDDVRSVCATPEGGLWVATVGGLSRWQDGRWKSHGSGRPRAIASDTRGRPWFSLAEFGPGALRTGETWMRVVLGADWQDPNSLRFARDGTLWVACERGLTWLKPDRFAARLDGTLEPDPTGAGPAFGRYRVGNELPRMLPLGLVEDSDGSMWLGSLAHGLVRVDAGHVERFGRQEGLPADHCVPVHRDSAGALWITGPGGLTRRWDGRFRTLTEQDGLPRDLPLDLIEDDFGNFWISGKRGIHRVSRQDLESFYAGRASRVHFHTLGVRDGLLTPECSSLHYPTMAKTPDGHLWVATRNGLATFDPRRVQLDTEPLPARIERLVVNREEVPIAPCEVSEPPARSGGEYGPMEPAAVLRLPPGSGERLEFQFTAVSLTAADRVTFRYRLEGYDSDWSPETDLRLAFYTNLKPGAYRFHVKAASPQGLWSERATVLGLVIEPSFWQTGTFRAAIGLILVSGAVGLHRLRLARSRRAAQVTHEQALIREKARIAADMHDELGATLTQISILGEVGRSQAGSPTDAGSILEQVSQLAREATSRMSALVWATHPHHDTLESLAAYLREHAASRLENLAIQARLEFPAALPRAARFGHVQA